MKSPRGSTSWLRFWPASSPITGQRTEPGKDFVGTVLIDSVEPSRCSGPLERLGWYLRGGAVFGWNLYNNTGDDAYTVYDHDKTSLMPFVQIGYRFAMSRSRIRDN